MIADEFAQGLRLAMVPNADDVFAEPVSAFAVAFERADTDVRRLVLDGLHDPIDDVQALAALLSIVAFGDVAREDFLGLADVILPDRPDRLAILMRAEPSALGLTFGMIEVAVYAPAELCRRLEELTVDAASSTRGWSVFALGFLADDEARLKVLATDLVRADPSSFVVACALFALVVGDMDSETTELLQEVTRTDPDGAVRGSAYMLLGLADGDLASAFSDVDSIALFGAMRGRTLAGRAGLSDAELRHVRARLRKRPADETVVPLLVQIALEAEQFDPALLTDVEECIAHLPPTVVAKMLPAVEGMVELAGGVGLTRVAVAVASRAKEVGDDLG